MNRVSAALERLYLDPATTPDASANPRGIRWHINAKYVKTQSKKFSRDARLEKDPRIIPG